MAVSHVLQMKRLEIWMKKVEYSFNHKVQCDFKEIERQYWPSASSQAVLVQQHFKSWTLCELTGGGLK